MSDQAEEVLMLDGTKDEQGGLLAEVRRDGLKWQKNRDSDALCDVYLSGWLEPGRTEAEILAILGPPDHNEGSNWGYISDDESYSFFIFWSDTHPKVLESSHDT